MEGELTANVPGISVSAASDDENEEDFSFIDNISGRGERKSSESSTSSTSSSNSDAEDGANTSARAVDNNDPERLIDNDNSNLIENAEKISLDDDADLQQPYEVVGDRILIEKDGKFELVDVSEVKADYFQMMGLEDGTEAKNSPEEKPASNGIENKEDASRKSPRPKTSPIRTSPRNNRNNNRASSAYFNTRRHDEYAHIRSRYAMTDHQLEMKKRKEEAIARRKKEEEEREKQELERKRQDAERAFQVWLRTKNEEAITNRKPKDKRIEQEREERNKAAETAYRSWLTEKAKQKKHERTVERLKKEEEESSYVIRQRQACEEAFNRWLKTKQAEARQKLAARKPRRKRRKTRGRETAPVNSSAIRFTDYYGYRNTVAL